MERVHSPDAAHEIASFRERLRAFRDRGKRLAAHGTATASQVQPDANCRLSLFGKPDTRDVPDTAWSDTQWTDTVFDSGDR